MSIPGRNVPGSFFHVIQMDKNTDNRRQTEDIDFPSALYYNLSDEKQLDLRKGEQENHVK